MAEVVDQPWTGRLPTQFVTGLLRNGALIEKQDLGEIVAKACSGLIVGTGDRTGASTATAAAWVSSATVGFVPSPMT